MKKYWITLVVILMCLSGCSLQGKSDISITYSQNELWNLLSQHDWYCGSLVFSFSNDGNYSINGQLREVTGFESLNFNNYEITSEEEKLILNYDNNSLNVISNDTRYVCTNTKPTGEAASDGKLTLTQLWSALCKFANWSDGKGNSYSFALDYFGVNYRTANSDEITYGRVNSFTATSSNSYILDVDYYDAKTKAALGKSGSYEIQFDNSKSGMVTIGGVAYTGSDTRNMSRSELWSALDGDWTNGEITLRFGSLNGNYYVIRDGITSSLIDFWTDAKEAANYYEITLTDTSGNKSEYGIIYDQKTLTIDIGDSSSLFDRPAEVQPEPETPVEENENVTE